MSRCAWDAKAEERTEEGVCLFSTYEGTWPVKIKTSPCCPAVLHS